MGKALAPTATIERLDELADDGDDLDEEDLAALRAAIKESEAQYQRGEYVTADQALAELDSILFGP
jgi:predicted transcriptional regulator